MRTPSSKEVTSSGKVPQQMLKVKSESGLSYKLLTQPQLSLHEHLLVTTRKIATSYEKKAWRVGVKKTPAQNSAGLGPSSWDSGMTLEKLLHSLSPSFLQGCL